MRPRLPATRRRSHGHEAPQARRHPSPPSPPTTRNPEPGQIAENPGLSWTLGGVFDGARVAPQDSVASAAARRSRAPRSASAAFSCRHVTATSAAAIASAASPPPHGRRVVEERGRRGRRSAESHDAASAGAARDGDLELVDVGEEDGEVMVGHGRGRRRFRRRRSCVRALDLWQEFGVKFSTKTLK